MYKTARRARRPSKQAGGGGNWQLQMGNGEIRDSSGLWSRLQRWSPAKRNNWVKSETGWRDDLGNGPNLGFGPGQVRPGPEVGRHVRGDQLAPELWGGFRPPSSQVSIYIKWVMGASGLEGQQDSKYC